MEKWNSERHVLKANVRNFGDIGSKTDISGEQAERERARLIGNFLVSKVRERPQGPPISHPY